MCSMSASSDIYLAAAAEAAPALTLDDLFRKTSTKPVLYFLPLSEEAAVARQARRGAAAARRKH